MDTKTKVISSIALYLAVDNVLAGIQIYRLKKAFAIEKKRADVLEEVFMMSSRYIADEHVPAIKEQTDFIMVKNELPTVAWSS